MSQRQEAAETAAGLRTELEKTIRRIRKPLPVETPKAIAELESELLERGDAIECALRALTNAIETTCLVYDQRLGPDFARRLRTSKDNMLSSLWERISHGLDEKFAFKIGSVGVERAFLEFSPGKTLKLLRELELSPLPSRFRKHAPASFEGEVVCIEGSRAFRKSECEFALFLLLGVGSKEQPPWAEVSAERAGNLTTRQVAFYFTGKPAIAHRQITTWMQSQIAGSRLDFDEVIEVLDYIRQKESDDSANLRSCLDMVQQAAIVDTWEKLSTILTVEGPTSSRKARVALLIEVQQGWSDGWRNTLQTAFENEVATPLARISDKITQEYSESRSPKLRCVARARSTWVFSLDDHQFELSPAEGLELIREVLLHSVGGTSALSRLNKHDVAWTRAKKNLKKTAAASTLVCCRHGKLSLDRQAYALDEDSFLKHEELVSIEPDDER